MADNLLDKASILLTPTAYDNGRMLSVKPNENLYGSELVTNGDFSNGSTGWTISGSASVGVNKLNVNAGAFDFFATQTTLTNGLKYKVTLDVEVTSGGILLYTGTQFGTISSSGSYTFYTTSDSTQIRFRSGGSGFVGSITNVSVVEDLSGDFTFSRSSAATRVNAQGLVENVQIISPELVSNGDFSQIGAEEVSNGNFSQEGSELVTNGDFATDSDWSKGTGWSIGDGVATHTGSQSLLAQYNIITIGKSYRISFDLTNADDSNYVRLISSQYPNGGDYKTDGTHVVYTSTNIAHFWIYGIGDVSIDNVSVKEVAQNWDLAANWSIAENKATSNGTSGNLYQSGIIVTGKQYKIQVTVSDYVSGTVQVSAGAVPRSTMSANGTYTFYQTASSTSNFFVISNIFNGSVTNISVKEVGQDWTFGTGWSIGDGKAVATSGSGSKLQQSISGLSGKTCKVSFTLSDYAGSGIALLDFGSTSGQSISANGTYTEIGTYDQNYFQIFKDSSFEGSISNISVKEITDDTDIPRINYSGFSYQDTLGSELVVNGDFSNGSANWFNPDGAATFSNNSVTINGGSGNRRINQPNVTSPTTSQFKLQYEITEKVGTSDLKVYTNNSGSAAYTIVPSTIGVHTFYFSSNLTTFYFNFSDSSGSITIDNVSVKEVTGQEVVPDSGCGSWLLEPQSTNLVTYSEDFSQSFYAKDSGVSVGSSNNTSPSGDMNATQINVTDNGRIYANMSSLTYYSSVFIKAGTFSYFKFAGINLDLVSETIVNGKIESYGNGWFRISIPYTGNRPFQIQAYPDATYSSHTTSGNYYIWGSQAEQLSYATSYIPTNGATNTRLQDIATNSGNSTLINSTEGVLYAEIAANENEGSFRQLTISDGSGSNRVSIDFTSTDNQIRSFSSSGGSTAANMSASVSNAAQFNKVAVKYKLNDYALWINGVEVATDTSASTPIGLSELAFDNGASGNKFYGKTKAVAVYKEALTDAELQSLTTI